MCVGGVMLVIGFVVVKDFVVGWLVYVIGFGLDCVGEWCVVILVFLVC